MLDSLGLGEVFFLALMALIFFGPENLPRMGARLGKWIGSLTRTSRTFLTEWREEALAVQEAVDQVRQIRDELYAARADIAGTLNATRTDVDEALGDARASVQRHLTGATATLLSPTTAAAARLPARTAAAPTVTSDEASLPAAEAPAAAPAGEGNAIARTQAILDQLARKRAASAPLPPLETLSPGVDVRGRGQGEENLTPGPSPERRGEKDLTPSPSPERRGEPEVDLEQLRAQVTEMASLVAAMRAELAEMRARREPALAMVE